MIKEQLDNFEKESWNRFLIEQNGSFLQSWQWGEFQKALGRGVFYLKDEDWQALVIKYELPFGKNYLYCPRPVLQIANCKSPIEEVINLAKEEKSIFIRIEPIFFCHSGLDPESSSSQMLDSRFRPAERGFRGNDKREGIGQELKELGFLKTKNIQPSKTLVLDLGASEEELFSKFHEKTRYNIGLAQRKGVKIRKAEYNENDFEVFWEIMNKTARRQGIRMFSKEYYRKELQIGKNIPQPLPVSSTGQALKEGNSLPLGMVGGDFQNLLFIAELEEKPIAANLVNIFGKTATYLHGGSDNEFRSLMAPHLLQWEQIKEAKKLDCQIYDFWGYDEQKWPGVSRFKGGFSGREVSYPGCFDYPIDKKWFFIYKLARKIL